jgi:hypothetical protein
MQKEGRTVHALSLVDGHCVMELPDPFMRPLVTGALALPGPEFGYWGSNNTNSKTSALNSRSSASSQKAGDGGKPGTPTSVGPAAASAALSEKSAANSKGSTGSARDSAHNSAGTATDVGAPPSLPEDAVPEDVLVMNAFWRQLRNQERWGLTMRCVVYQHLAPGASDSWCSVVCLGMLPADMHSAPNS